VSAAEAATVSAAGQYRPDELGCAMPPRRRSTPTKSTPTNLTPTKPTPSPATARTKRSAAKKPAAVARIRTLSFVPDPSHLIAGLTGVVPAPAVQQPDYAFRILRPDDLVVLEVACFGLELNKQGGAAAYLTPIRDGAYLVVGYTFQHVGEQAFHETESPATSDTPDTPVAVLVAEPSRLVFDVPSSEQITYSSEGVLAALSRLTLRVAPLATALPEYTLPPVSTPLVTLAGGLVLARGPDGLTLAKVSGRTPAVATSATALIAQASAMKMARTLLAAESAVDHAGVRNGIAVSAPVTTTGGISLRRPVSIRPRRGQPRRPLPDETAIEAPWRLILSPSVLAGFAHASTPQAALDDPDHIELWHSRLGVRSVDPDDHVVTIDERADAQRIVRAIWDRDQDGAEPAATDATTPFRTSLTGQWRRNLVTESADPTLAVPTPVNAQRLYLSSLGAWLDLHGKWVTTPYEGKIPESIESWDHIAPMGRDQYVKVSNPGYLFPFGHRASKVTVTERRIDASGSPTAYLYQYTYILVREPVKTYDDNEMPLSRIEFKTLITPKLDLPVAPFTVDLLGSGRKPGSAARPAAVGRCVLQQPDQHPECLFGAGAGKERRSGRRTDRSAGQIGHTGRHRVRDAYVVLHRPANSSTRRNSGAGPGDGQHRRPRYEAPGPAGPGRRREVRPALRRQRVQRSEQRPAGVPRTGDAVADLVRQVGTRRHHREVRRILAARHPGARALARARHRR
jgi:hypothetical protein